MSERGGSRMKLSRRSLRLFGKRIRHGERTRLCPRSSALFEKGGWAETLARAGCACVLATGMTRLALIFGGGPPSLFWPTNGVIIIILNFSASTFDLALTSCTGALGLAWGQEYLTGYTIALQLATANLVEYVLASIVMRCMIGRQDLLTLVKTTRFLGLVVFVTGALASCVGATAGTFVVVYNFPNSSLQTTWIDWFVGDLTGNFIVLYIGHLAIAHCRRGQLSDLLEHLKTRAGRMQLGAFCTSALIVAVVYSLDDLTPTGAIPLMLLASPALGNLALVMPQIVSAALDLVLVLSAVTGSRAGRGPVIALLARDYGERDVFLCIQVALLLSTILTATLAVAREQRIMISKRDKATSDEKLAFFTHVSHEFRTPLSVVIGYTEDLLEHQRLNPAVREDLENIHNASVGMSAMVEDLMSLFRMETHGLVLTARTVNTRDFLSKLRSLAIRLASPKGHSIALDADLPPYLVFDPNRVNQVLTNLVSNAVKFTPPNGAVTIRARIVDNNAKENAALSGSSKQLVNSHRTPELVAGARGVQDRSATAKIGFGSMLKRFGRGPKQGTRASRASSIITGPTRFTTDVLISPDRRCSGSMNASIRTDKARYGRTRRCGDYSSWLSFSVQDTGVGISPEDMCKLFERFFRVGTLGVEGTGLGLTICKNIATAIGGSITVESEVGSGSTFTMSFPVGDAPDEWHENSAASASSTPMLVKAAADEQSAVYVAGKLQEALLERSQASQETEHSAAKWPLEIPRLHVGSDGKAADTPRKIGVACRQPGPGRLENTTRDPSTSGYGRGDSRRIYNPRPREIGHPWDSSGDLEANSCSGQQSKRGPQTAHLHSQAGRRATGGAIEVNCEKDIHPDKGRKSMADYCGNGDEGGGELQGEAARWGADGRRLAIGNDGNAECGNDAMSGDYSGSHVAANRPQRFGVGSRDIQYYTGGRHGSFVAVEAGIRGSNAAFMAGRSSSGNELDLRAEARGTVDSAASTGSRDWNERADTGGCAPASGEVKVQHSSTGGDSVARDDGRGDAPCRCDVARDLPDLPEAQGRTGVPGRLGCGDLQEASSLRGYANVPEDLENLRGGRNRENGGGGVLSLDRESLRGDRNRQEEEGLGDTGTGGKEAEIIVIENKELAVVGSSGSGSRSMDSSRGGGAGSGGGSSSRGKNDNTNVVSNSNNRANSRGENGGVNGTSDQRVRDNTVNSNGSVLSSKVFVLHVLLAEDSIPNQKLMVRILEREGHTVEAVVDGLAAVNALKAKHFDLLMLDLGLPKMDGMQVLETLRSLPASHPARDMPVIVSSGHVLDEQRRQCLDAGCQAFTEKPFRAKVIVDTVQRVMREREEMKFARKSPARSPPASRMSTVVPSYSPARVEGATGTRGRAK